MEHKSSIEIAPIEPTPRHYPALVTLVRRGRFAADQLAPQSAHAVEAWLLDAAIENEDLLALYQEFAWRLIAAELPIVRASLHIGTLHPQVYGYAWNFSVDDGLCDEVKVDQAMLAADAYRKNPLFRVIEHGERLRMATDSAEAAESPLLRDLRAGGITEYAAFPLKARGAYHNAATVATRAPGGFSGDAFDTIERLLRIFALHVERDIAARISTNIVTTYLGDEAGARVLRGSIKRGDGTAIDAVIWASDLRGFTTLSERLEPRALTRLLNAYFEALAGAVMDHGGEVLKFIGDGLLAVFPFDDFASKSAAAEAAIGAAGAAFEALKALNEDPETLADLKDLRPLRTGIALHAGEVFFGNVGAPQRLDFTVIGRAVNATSRVESLCKPTGEAFLVTDAVRALSGRPFHAVGRFDLPGLDRPVAVFALDRPPAAGQ